MSMIDCNINVEKKTDPKGDRVVLTFEWVLALCVQSPTNLSGQWKIPSLFPVVNIATGKSARSMFGNICPINCERQWYC